MNAGRISVIVPTRNAAATIVRCLEAIHFAAGELPSADWELIVVDDASTDETAPLAEEHGAQVARLPTHQGAAQARNAGVAAARGQVIVFVDADVVIHADVLRKLAEALEGNSLVDAVFGSYDDAPAHRGLVSSFRNLLHHWVHQQGSGGASTFWTGCGAVTREAFDAVGGFRDGSLTCMEDVDFGHRLHDAGRTIQLRPDIKCTHLKQWTLVSMVKTDVLRRGIPWTVMMWRRGRTDDSLNFATGERTTGLFAVGAVLGLLVSLFAGLGGRMSASALAVAAAFFLLGCFVWRQRNFYNFLARTRSWRFALGCLPLHTVYYVYSAVALVAGSILWLVIRLRGVE